MRCSQLPEHVVEEILSWLPVKSIVRFKCVKKSWNNLFESQHFIMEQMQHGIAKRKIPSFIVKRCDMEIEKDVMTLHPRDVHSDSTDMVLPYDLELMPVCANGIICMSDRDNETIILGNPALREFKTVTLDPPIAEEDFRAYVHSIGFGYGAKGDAYKVVRIISAYHKQVPVFLHPFVDVYNLKSKSWKKLEMGLGFSCDIARGEIYLRGAYHWSIRVHGSSYGSTTYSDMILAFDMNDEALRFIPFAESRIGCDPEFAIFSQLAVFNDSIALVTYKWVGPSYDMPLYDIWVMEEYGVKESWIKKFVIGPLVGVDRPLMFWNDEKLLLRTKGGEIMSLDLITQKTEITPVDGTGVSVCGYSESTLQVEKLLG